MPDMDEKCREYCEKENKTQTREKPIKIQCEVCILLAICKSQEEIRCDSLWEILRLATMNKEDAITLDYIKNFFPNSKEIYKYTINESPHISFRWKEK